MTTLSLVSRFAPLPLALLLAAPLAQAADFPASAELQYVGPYGVPATMTFNRSGSNYKVVASINVPMYQMRFESSGSINGNTLQTADARVRNWLAKQGINDAGLVLENGSGLSRTERISANQMAAILAVGARSLWNPEFSSSMPVAALDGTMRKRLKGSAGELRARIKTGTLKNTTAIAGYVRDIRDQQWIVVAMINHDDAAKARSALDELLNWVAAGRP